MNIKKFLCSLLTITTTVMGCQGVLVGTASASPNCSPYSAADECTRIKVGANTVSYPKLKWTLVSKDASRAAIPVLTNAAANDMGRNAVTGNDAAQVLALSAAQAPTAMSSFPSNVPMVVGRYEPMSKTLRVDIFKIERLMVDGTTVNALYQSAFSPAYGDFWKAAGTYLSADERKLGNSIGPNPFSAFAKASDDNFNDISLKGAMVVLGHAQRYVGSPVSVLINNVATTEQYTQKSGGLLKKKITQHVDYSVQPEYYVGAPLGIQGGIAVSYCANDPTLDHCDNHQVASSGVAFMKLEGGNMQEDKTLLHKWSHSTTGFTLLAVFLIALVVAFAFAAIGPVFAAGTTATTGTVTAGFWSSMASLVSGGAVGSTSLLGASLIEAGIYTTVTGAAGSGFGGVYEAGKGVAYAQERALDPAADLGHESAYQYRDVVFGLRQSNVDNRTLNRVTGKLEDTLAPVQGVLLGTCASNQLLSTCTAEARASGVVPRADQFTTFNSVEFYRDNLPNVPRRAAGP